MASIKAEKISSVDTLNINSPYKQFGFYQFCQDTREN